jgi:hypothetical protein
MKYALSIHRRAWQGHTGPIAGKGVSYRSGSPVARMMRENNNTLFRKGNHIWYTTMRFEAVWHTVYGVEEGSWQWDWAQRIRVFCSSLAI